jgi:glycosyltransferase involved in cell wall biosynthesis
MNATRPPRVVHLSSVHPADDTRIFHKQCRTLAAAGYDVVLIAQAALAGASVPGIRVVVLPRPSSRWRRLTRTTWRVLRDSWREHAGLYHLHDPELLPVGLVLKLRGAKVIYDVHEDWPAAVDSREWIPVPLRRLASWGIAAVEFCAARLFDSVVVVTPEIAARFPAEKVALVQNFPLAEEWDAPERARGNDPPIVVYVGDVTEIRGAHTMVEAMGRLSPGVAARLVVAGTFSPPPLEDALHKLPGSTRLETRAWLSRADVMELLATASMGLVLYHPSPNHSASQPNKLFEYMAAGLPVIASDFPRWREIVGPSEAGLLVDPLDPASIAGAIAQVLSDPAAADKMGRNGRAAVADRFGWASQGEVLLQLYRSLSGAAAGDTRSMTKGAGEMRKGRDHP